MLINKRGKFEHGKDLHTKLRQLHKTVRENKNETWNDQNKKPNKPERGVKPLACTTDNLSSKPSNAASPAQ
jgi:hypothetical protein